MEVPLPTLDTAKALVQDVFDRAAALGVTVDCIDDFSDMDGLFTKIIKHANSFVVESVIPDASFIDSLQAIGSELGRKGRYLSPSFSKLASLSRSFNLARQKYNDTVSHIVQSQLNVTATGASPVELKDNLDKAMKYYEKERAKKSSKGFTEKKQAALDTQQRVLQNSACDYLLQMQGVREKREIEFSKHLFALYRAQQQFFADSANIMQEVVTLSDQVMRAATTEKSKMDSSKVGLQDLRQKYEKAVFNCERQEKELERIEKGGARTTAVPTTTSGPIVQPVVQQVVPPVQNSKLLVARRISEQDATSFNSGATTDSAHRQSLDFLEEILQLPGNEICADCGKDRPRWGICDLGVIICDDCVAIHREPANSLKGEHRVLGMASHIRQIVVLDTQDPDALNLFMLKAIGNANANSILEARLASGPLSHLKIKPGPTSSIDEKRAFIGKKYDLREYAIKPDRQLSLVSAFKAGTLSKTGVAFSLFVEVIGGVNMASPDATEALHLAVAEGDSLAVDFLLRNGCAPNQSIQSYTPLHIAAQMDRADVAKLLLRHGASVSTADPSGKTALELAKASQSAAVVRLLTQHAEGDATVLREPIYISVWARSSGGSPGARRGKGRSDPIYAQIDELGKSKPPSLSGSISSAMDGSKPVPARKAPPPPGPPSRLHDNDADSVPHKSPRMSRAAMGVQVLPTTAGPVQPVQALNQTSVVSNPPSIPVPMGPPPTGPPSGPPTSSLVTQMQPPTTLQPPSIAPPTNPPNSATPAQQTTTQIPRTPKPAPVVNKRNVVPPPPIPPPETHDPPPFTEHPPPTPPVNTERVPITPGPITPSARASFSRPMIFIPPPPSNTVTAPSPAGSLAPPSIPPPNGPPSGPPTIAPPTTAPPVTAPPSANLPPSQLSSVPVQSSLPPQSPVNSTAQHVEEVIPPFSPPRPPTSPRQNRKPPPLVAPKPATSNATPSPLDTMSADDLPAPPLSLVNPDVNLRSLDDEIEA